MSKIGKNGGNKREKREREKMEIKVGDVKEKRNSKDEDKGGRCHEKELEKRWR